MKDALDVIVDFMEVERKAINFDFESRDNRGSLVFVLAICSMAADAREALERCGAPHPLNEVGETIAIQSLKIGLEAFGYTVTKRADA